MHTQQSLLAVTLLHCIHDIFKIHFSLHMATSRFTLACIWPLMLMYELSVASVHHKVYQFSFSIGVHQGFVTAAPIQAMNIK